jgi:hypothetical protein
MWGMASALPNTQLPVTLPIASDEDPHVGQGFSPAEHASSCHAADVEP